jgi:hypothetical protein
LDRFSVREYFSEKFGGWIIDSSREKIEELIGALEETEFEAYMVDKILSI